MRRVILQYWNRRWQTVSFDTDSGRGRVRWLSSERTQTLGWACRYGGKWYSLWTGGEGLLFQVCKQKYRLGGELEFANEVVKGANRRRFSIVERTHCVFELEYPSVRYTLANRFDPTFDDFDEEEYDFFLWVARVAADRELQNGLAQQWAFDRDA